MSHFPDFTLENARQLDRADSLSSFRDRFHLPTGAQGELVYLCGNSLGLQPREVGAALEEILKDWSRLAVEGHFAAARPWMPYHRLLAASGEKLVGARPGEVVFMNSLSVNLHLLMASFYRPSGSRTRILVEGGAFPSDRYAVATHLEHHGLDPDKQMVQLRPREGEDCLRPEDILATIEAQGDRLALILLGGVNYYTGQAFDMREITRAGHAVGARVAFDLAHAAGNLELALHDWNVDWAAWCGYKYLNSGPGGISGVFVHERHGRDTTLPRLAGWWGHDSETRFAMPERFQAMEGAEGWQLSNPPILPLAALRASLELFDEAGMPALRARSLRLTAWLEQGLDAASRGRFRQLTPRDPAQRGAQLSLHFPGGATTVMRELEAAGVLADLRRPDVIRLSPAPLYNSFEDCWHAVQRLDGLPALNSRRP
ncbi:MAG: kynureninase [Candidatus Cloacimonetes bacterium]|nr:kynureninase [Candidatus Cloacimonadota bacterium]